MAGVGGASGGNRKGAAVRERNGTYVWINNSFSWTNHRRSRDVTPGVCSVAGTPSTEPRLPASVMEARKAFKA